MVHSFFFPLYPVPSYAYKRVRNTNSTYFVPRPFKYVRASFIIKKSLKFPNFYPSTHLIIVSNAIGKAKKKKKKKKKKNDDTHLVMFSCFWMGIVGLAAPSDLLDVCTNFQTSIDTKREQL